MTHKKLIPATFLLLGLMADAIALTPLQEDRPRGDHQLRDTGYLMPSYELWIVELTCSNARYRARIGLSKITCARVMSQLCEACSRRLGKQMPRNDSREIDGRLRYRDFVARYQKCLKRRFNGEFGSREDSDEFSGAGESR